MRALVAALALCLLGCGSPGPTAVPVELLTGDGPGFTFENGACYTFGVDGLVVADPAYGTAIRVESWPANGPSDPMPIMWRVGFTGWQVGSEVWVRDPAGTLVLKTGAKYRLDGGYWSENPRVFFACGSVTST